MPIFDIGPYRRVKAVASQSGGPADVEYDRMVFDWSVPIGRLIGRMNFYEDDIPPNGVMAIYVITVEGEPFCKIGISDRPGFRCKDLQTAHWKKVAVHSVLWVSTRKDARLVEKATHQAADSKRIARHGEWVEMNPQAAMVMILEVSASLNIEAFDPIGLERSAENETIARHTAWKNHELQQKQAKFARQGY